MKTISSFLHIIRHVVSAVTQLAVVLGLFSVVWMPIGASSDAGVAFVDPVAVRIDASSPILASNPWILSLPARERFVAEKLTRMEQLYASSAPSQVSVPSECASPLNHQQIAALAAQTGLSQLSVFKSLQVDCYPYK
jgi:hypothetical protein